MTLLHNVLLLLPEIVNGGDAVHEDNDEDEDCHCWLYLCSLMSMMHSSRDGQLMPDTKLPDAVAALLLPTTMMTLMTIMMMMTMMQLLHFCS